MSGCVGVYDKEDDKKYGIRKFYYQQVYFLSFFRQATNGAINGDYSF